MMSAEAEFCFTCGHQGAHYANCPSHNPKHAMEVMLRVAQTLTSHQYQNVVKKLSVDTLFQFLADETEKKTGLCVKEKLRLQVMRLAYCQSKFGSGAIGLEALCAAAVDEVPGAFLFIVRIGTFLRSWEGGGAFASNQAYQPMRRRLLETPALHFTDQPFEKYFFKEAVFS